jgi:hypothetical protein
LLLGVKLRACDDCLVVLLVSECFVQVALSQGIVGILTLHRLLILRIFAGRLVGAVKVLNSFEVEFIALERQVKWREALEIVLHLELQRHLRIVEQPELRVKTNLEKALDLCDVATDVELILKLAFHFEEKFALFKEAEWCFMSELRLFVGAFESFRVKLFVHFWL